MLFRLLLLMTVIPLLELWLLFEIADRTSGWFAFGLVLVTGAVGASLARWQGWRAMQRIQRELSQGQMPGGALLDGLLIFVAGVVLVTPGVMTDAVGFLLLIPPTRALAKRYLTRRFQHHFQVNSHGFEGTWTSGQAGFSGQDPPIEKGGDRIVDSYVIDAEPPNSKDDDSN